MKATPYRSSDRPSAIANVRATIEREFSSLREQQPRVFHLALNEAEAIAWQTAFPELVFPSLALEKVQRVEEWHAHQETLRQAEPAMALAA